MSEIKTIFTLPILTINQEWACKHGCSNVQPRLYRHVYSQTWDKKGNLVEEMAEYYYTCSYGHKLTVWDNLSNDYAELDPKCYMETTT